MPMSIVLRHPTAFSNEGRTPRSARMVAAAAFLISFATVAQGEVVFQGPQQVQNCTLQNGAAATATGQGFDFDTTQIAKEWAAVLSTKPAGLFVDGQRYRVSFDYEVTKANSDQSRFVASFRTAEPTDYKQRTKTWHATAGERGRKEFAFTLRNGADWNFLICTFNGVAMSINNLKIEAVPLLKLKPGFVYQSPMVDDERLDLIRSGKIVKGGLDVVTPSEKWNHILQTVPQEVVLTPGHSYLVSYTYTIAPDARQGSRMHHYSGTTLTDSAGRQNWESWEATPGQSERKEFTVCVTEPDSRIFIGDFGGTSVRIEDFTIQDLGQE